MPDFEKEDALSKELRLLKENEKTYSAMHHPRSHDVWNFIKKRLPKSLVPKQVLKFWLTYKLGSVLSINCSVLQESKIEIISFGLLPEDYEELLKDICTEYDIKSHGLCSLNIEGAVGELPSIKSESHPYAENHERVGSLLDRVFLD